MQPEPYEGKEIHFHVTGAISASLVPWWLLWFLELTPGVTTNVSVTRAAQSFVSLRALERLATGRVWSDTWESEDTPPEVHTGRSGDSECFVIFPATIDTTMRLAQGRTDSPALMMLQTTELPIVIADAHPARNAVIDEGIRVLLSRRNVELAPRIQSIRASDRSVGESGFNLPGAITVANSLITKG